MAKLPKQEFQPLLEAGFHPLTIAQVRAMCVDGFPGSQTRARIMAGLEAMVDLIASRGLSGELWINGSFTTKKPNPSDVDFVLFTPASVYDGGNAEMQQFLDGLNEDDPKSEYREKYGCDTHWVGEYPPQSALHVLTLATRQNWDKRGFGKAVVSGELKGIAVLYIHAAQGAKGGAK